MTFLIDAKLFANNMTYHRERCNYTVRQLADITLLPYHLIQSLEAGLTVPTSIQLERVARALSVNVEQLILPRPIKAEYSEGC